MPHLQAPSPTVLLQVHSVKSAEVQRERPTVARRYATQVAVFQPWQYLLLRLQRPGPIAPDLQIGTVGQLQAVSQLHVQCIHARGCGIDAAGVQVGDGAGPACRIARQIGTAPVAAWKQTSEERRGGQECARPASPRRSPEVKKTTRRQR